jgi:hypothetical protein
MASEWTLEHACTCLAPELQALSEVSKLVDVQRTGTILISPSRPAEKVSSSLAPESGSRLGQYPPALQVLFSPTSQFPLSRLGKVPSSLAGSQLPPGRGSALAMIPCGVDPGGPSRESDLASQSGHLAGIGKA